MSICWHFSSGEASVSLFKEFRAFKAFTTTWQHDATTARETLDARCPVSRPNGSGLDATHIRGKRAQMNIGATQCRNVLVKKYNIR